MRGSVDCDEAVSGERAVVIGRRKSRWKEIEDSIASEIGGEIDTEWIESEQ